MFKCGDIVVYGTSGICRVDSITKRDFGDSPKEYFVLKPLFSERTTIYAPVNTIGSQINVRAVLSANDATAVIKSFSELDDTWIINDIERKEKFRSSLKSADPNNLAKTLKMLYFHKKELSQHGKKLHSYDDEVMRTAEKLLFSELAFALDTTAANVMTQIKEQAPLPLNAM